MLTTNDQCIYEDQAIKDLVLEFYSDLYSSSMFENSFYLSENSFPPIGKSDMAFLTNNVSIEETRIALFCMKNYKSPGPDGFHPMFFKSQWDIIGFSLHNFVSQCFLHPENIKELNNTLITLIPKCDNPSSVTQFWPISLCNVAYKVITKVLT